MSRWNAGNLAKAESLVRSSLDSGEDLSSCFACESAWKSVGRHVSEPVWVTDSISEKLGVELGNLLIGFLDLLFHKQRVSIFVTQSKVILVWLEGSRLAYKAFPKASIEEVGLEHGWQKSAVQVVCNSAVHVFYDLKPGLAQKLASKISQK